MSIFVSRGWLISAICQLRAFLSICYHSPGLISGHSFGELFSKPLSDYTPEAENSVLLPQVRSSWRIFAAISIPLIRNLTITFKCWVKVWMDLSTTIERQNIGTRKSLVSGSQSPISSADPIELQTFTPTFVQTYPSFLCGGLRILRLYLQPSGTRESSFQDIKMSRWRTGATGSWWKLKIRWPNGSLIG